MHTDEHMMHVGGGKTEPKHGYAVDSDMTWLPQGPLGMTSWAQAHPKICRAQGQSTNEGPHIMWLNSQM